MAKILVLSLPAHGHVNPVAPLVVELVRRGHDVVACNDIGFAGRFEGLGARFLPYPAAMSLEDLTRILKDGNLIAFFELLLAATPPLYRFSRAAIAAEQPDLVIFDGTCLWAQGAVRKAGLPGVSTMPFFIFELFRNGAGPRELLGHSARFFPRLHRLALNGITLLRRSPGAIPRRLPLFPLRGDLNILFTTREIHPPTPIFDDSFLFAGASIDPASRPERFDMSALPQRRIVYFSLGTLHHSNDRLLRGVISAMADMDVTLLVSGGPDDPARLGPLPQNTIVARSFPQLDVLGKADVFITHAGLNSIHESLWAGVPMVAVPQQFEQLRNALTVSRRGAGITLEAEAYRRPLDGGEVRAAVETVLGDPGYRERARALGASLNAAGGFRSAADAIETRFNLAQRQAVKHVA